MLCVRADITPGQLKKWKLVAKLDFDHKPVAKWSQAATADYFQDCPTAVFCNVETQEMLNAKVTLEKVRLVWKLGPMAS